MSIKQPASPISIAVSSCLLGHKVRYDGSHKYHPTVSHQLCKIYHCIAICPETFIGLTVPRARINLVSDSQSIRAIVDDEQSSDITAQLQQCADTVAAEIRNVVHGYVFKVRSPSCGLRSAPVQQIADAEITRQQGIFCRRLLQNIPGLPAIEESELNDSAQLAHFRQQIEDYADSETFRANAPPE